MDDWSSNRVSIFNDLLVRQQLLTLSYILAIDYLKLRDLEFPEKKVGLLYAARLGDINTRLSYLPIGSDIRTNILSCLQYLRVRETAQITHKSCDKDVHLPN